MVRKRKRITELHQTPLEDGPTPVKSSPLEPTEDIEDTSSPTHQPTLQNPESSTQESLRVNNRKTFKIKPISSPKDIQITRSFTTSDRVSITTEKGLAEFWNESSKDLSKKLWLPTKTASLDLDTNSSKLFSIDVAPELLSPKKPTKSVTSKSLPKTSSQSSQYLQPDTTGDEVIKPQKQARKLKVVSKPKARARARAIARPVTNQTKKTKNKTTKRPIVRHPKTPPVTVSELSEEKLALEKAAREIKKDVAHNEMEATMATDYLIADDGTVIKQPKIQPEPIDSESSSERYYSDDDLIDVPDSNCESDDECTDTAIFDTIIEAPTKIKDTYVCRKIRIFPTTVQKKYFNKCFGASRYIYNTAVRHVNNRIDERNDEIEKAAANGCVYLDEKGNQCCGKFHEDNKRFCEEHIKAKGRYGYNIDISRPALKKVAAPADKRMPKGLEWQKEIQYNTRQYILDDFAAAYKAALTNARNGNIKSFRMGYKPKRGSSQIFHIDRRAITTDLEIFRKKKIGKLRLGSKIHRWFKKNIQQIDANCKIIRYRDGSYYLLLSVKKKTASDQKPFDVVSTDPGVRTFQSIYSPSGITGMLGDGIVDDRLMPIARRIDHLDSALSKSKGRTRRNLKRRMALLRTKIKNIVNNLHWETIGFLTRNFNTIITTTFEVKEMTSKSNALSSKASRKMLTLSHGAFREKLISKAIQTGNRLIIANESYTSKTCTNCGNIKKNLGANKRYSCDKCGMKMHRDINGARNIMIRTFSAESESV